MGALSYTPNHIDTCAVRTVKREVNAITWGNRLTAMNRLSKKGEKKPIEAADSKSPFFCKPNAGS